MPVTHSEEIGADFRYVCHVATVFCLTLLWYRLQVAQNTLARVVCQAPCSASATELRRHLHWLPVRHRIRYKTAVITYRTRTTQTPTYLASLIHPYTPSRTLRSSDQLLLTAPRVTLALSAKAFSVNAPAVWNSLSLNCRSASSLSIFKRRLKSELFTSAYGPYTTGLDTVAKRLRFACD